MADFVEQLSDVELQNPIDMPAPLSRRFHGIQGRLPRPVAIGVRQEDGFHVRLESHFDDRLRHAICYRGHTQNAFSAILLRNGDRFHRRWEVRPRRHPVPEFVQVVLQVRFEVGNRLLVYTTTARIGLDGLEGFIHQRLWNVERLCCTHSLPPVSSCFYKCSPLTQPLRSEPHYRAFIATTGRSVPACCIGTLASRFHAACASPFCINTLVPTVPHESPGQSHALSTPVAAAQYPGVRQAYPQGVHALGFDDEFFSLRRVNEGFLSVVSLTSTGSGIPRCFNLQRSPPRLLTAAAWSGLEPAPESRLRRVHLHLSRSFCTVGQVILLMPSFLCTAAH